MLRSLDLGPFEMLKETLASDFFLPSLRIAPPALPSALSCPACYPDNARLYHGLRTHCYYFPATTEAPPEWTYLQGQELETPYGPT